MTLPRSSQVCLDETLWYHCVCRCVRRAFLCGKDTFTGKDYDYRRGWIADRMMELAGIFAIDVAAYAVMSNHYHIVVHVDPDQAQHWTTREVLERWTRIFSGPSVIGSYLRQKDDEIRNPQIQKLAETYRERLCDLSWFMRVLNESIARKANCEDGVRGRFWESRYKSQAILDEKALLAAMAYVDLNPVRAGMAETPEDSHYTSIKERVDKVRVDSEESVSFAPAVASRASSASNPTSKTSLRAELAPFEEHGEFSFSIPFGFSQYLQLVDWTGRHIRQGKQGNIAMHTPEILHRLGIQEDVFLEYAMRFLKAFGSAVGTPESMKRVCEMRGIRHLKGAGIGRIIFVDEAA